MFLVLFSQGRGLYIVTNGLSAYHTWAHIHCILSEENFKVGLTDLSEKIGVLSVQGPKRCVCVRTHAYVHVHACHSVIIGHGFTDPDNK